MSSNVLDRWILSLSNRLTKDVTESLDQYNTVTAINKLADFVTDFSTWYIRRSRDRVGPAAQDGADKSAFYSTCFSVLVSVSKLFAPLAPFISEEIYRNLTDDESVHLTDWPSFDKNLIDEKLEKEMTEARKIVEMAHAKRKEEGIKLRQPLASLASTSTIPVSDLVGSIVAGEVNVKKFLNKVSDSISINLDIKPTEELKMEAEAREIVRSIQAERKNIGTALNERVDVQISSWPKNFEQYIKDNALVDNLVENSEFKVLRKNA
jgi:isoleucyl-tRNA synthetase